MTPFKLTLKKSLRPRPRMVSLGIHLTNNMAILASPVVLPRYYSSQSVRHLFTQQQEAKDGVTESNNDLLDDGSKKWSKHVMPSKTALAEQANETQKKQPRKRRRRRQLKPLKSVLTLTPNAVIHLKQLMNQPIPKLIRVSVRNRGCSGLSYHLEYVTKADKFDEEVTQDGVKILVDSKALFSIIGSEMDWVDNKLASKFVFKNPNSKGTCGCGESFMV